nr:MAG TPA: Protein of unknown function (DUF1043) [Caudoviricetes sp.]
MSKTAVQTLCLFVSGAIYGAIFGRFMRLSDTA